MTAVTLNLEWFDDYAIWDHMEMRQFYRDIPIQVPKSYLWAPAIFVWNSAGNSQLIDFKNDSILDVYSNGEVVGKLLILLDTECDMHIYKYRSYNF